MSQWNGKRLGEVDVAARNLLDKLLEGKSDEFRAKVYELVVGYGWDVDDPSFAILIATGQLEVLLEDFPQEFEALFGRLSAAEQQRFQGMRQYLDSQRRDIGNYLRGVEATSTKLVSRVSEEVKQLQRFATTERTQVRQDLRQVLSLAEEEKESLVKEVKAQAELDQRQYFAAVQGQAKKLVEEAGDVWRLAYFREAGTLVALVGAGLLLVGLGCGIHLAQDFQQADSTYQWGQRMWSWNQAQFLECEKQGRTTCNFHIVEPGK